LARVLIEAEDLLIGATALHHQLKLATGNIWHFERIEGLVLVSEAVQKLRSCKFSCDQSS